jgi:hypothetical protein
VLAVVVLRGKTAEQTANGNINLTETPHFDWLGLVLATASFTALVYGFTQASLDGWNAPTVTGGVLAGCVLLAAFVLVEIRVPDPVMDLRLFRSYTFTIANVLAWLSSAVFSPDCSSCHSSSNKWNIFPLSRPAKS